MKEGYQTSAVWMRGKGNSAPAVLLQGPKPLTTVMVSLMALPTPQLRLYPKLFLFIQSSAFRGKSLPQCLTQHIPKDFPKFLLFTLSD